LVDADEDRQPVLELEQEFDCSDPRQVIQLMFTVRNLVFPEEGEYRLQLFASGEFLMERRIIIKEIPKKLDK
jgi:hypothetical protein